MILYIFFNQTQKHSKKNIKAKVFTNVAEFV